MHTSTTTSASKPQYQHAIDPYPAIHSGIGGWAQCTEKVSPRRDFMDNTRHCGMHRNEGPPFPPREFCPMPVFPSSVMCQNLRPGHPTNAMTGMAMHLSLANFSTIIPKKTSPNMFSYLNRSSSNIHIIWFPMTMNHIFHPASPCWPMISYRVAC